MARVRINPVQYNPVSRTIKVHQRVVVKMIFSLSPQEIPEEDALNSVLEDALLNGKDAVKWKISRSTTDSVNFFARYSVWCRIKTETTGVYQITPKGLKDAGFDTKVIDPRTFRIFTIDRYQINGVYPDTMVEVPIYVKGEEDGKFDSKDYILFYARSPSCWNDSLTEWQANYYTNYRVFWLTWGRGEGRRIGAISGTGAANPINRALNRVRVEEDLLCPARSGLLWVWERYLNDGTGSVKFYRQFTLTNRDTIKSIRVRFYGWTEKEGGETYSVVLSLNGVVLDTVSIIAKNSGVPPSNFEFAQLPFSAAVRTVKSDTLGVELLGRGDVYLDYIEVDYVTRLEFSGTQRSLEFFTKEPGDFAIGGAGSDLLVFDVTNPYEPKIIEGEMKGNQFKFRMETQGLKSFFCLRESHPRQVVSLEERHPGGLRTLRERADYYIICPREFLPVARLFAQHREGNIAGISNARVKAVPLDEIYDDYAFGMEEPGAIKAFFAAKRPVYGLFVGDATYDYKDNLRLGKTLGVPSYQIGFDLDYEVYNEHVLALEAWYADFEGVGSSPDMILARITSRTPQEFRQFLEKIRRYETQELGLWAKRFLLLGDDEYKGSPEPEKREGFVHILGCEGIAALSGNLLDVVKVYLTEYPFEAVKSKPKAAAELLRQLNLGALLWCFFGHGAGFQLCHERAFNIEDVPKVKNGGRNPLAFFGSCGVGRFEDTRYQAIAEELVRSEEGCIASIGASKATYSSSNETFARTLFSRLLQEKNAPIGPAFYQAWLGYNRYILFGDPTVRLRLPEVDSPPIVTPDTFYPGGGVAWRANSQLNEGFFEIRATEADRERFYQSEGYGITYVLPGLEIFRGLGRFSEGKLSGSFIVPRVNYPDTVNVGNGRYIRKRETCRVSGLVWNASVLKGYSILSLPLYLSPEALSPMDSQPPEIIAKAGNVFLKLNDTVRVTKRFNLTGEVSDPGGILLTKEPDYGLSCYLGDRSQKIELADYFSYNLNSSTSGSFSYPLELAKERDSLVIIASDNFLNRRIAVYHLVTDLREELRLDNCLVYPNPVQSTAWFTFVLSRPARVSIKIFTISGRLVRILGPKECQFGYNQMEWDGKDKDGNRLSNGVYLYKIDAHYTEMNGGTAVTRSKSFRDRFIIRR
ncbi:MAG: C25 family cysteine peptidase [candidate division WOR-3 bacterium]